MSAICKYLQGRVAGLTISGSPPNMTIQIRNSGTPLFILDGMRTDAVFINTLQANQVEAVEVFKGPKPPSSARGPAGALSPFTPSGATKTTGATTARLLPPASSP